MGAGGKEPIIGPLQPGWAPNILDYVCSDEDMNWAKAKARQQRGLRIERSFELRQLGHWSMQWLMKMTMTTHDDQDDNQSAPTYRDNRMDDNKCDNRMAMDTRYAEADASDDNREAMMLSHTHPMTTKRRRHI